MFYETIMKNSGLFGFDHMLYTLACMLILAIPVVLIDLLVTALSKDYEYLATQHRELTLKEQDRVEKNAGLLGVAVFVASMVMALHLIGGIITMVVLFPIYFKSRTMVGMKHHPKELEEHKRKYKYTMY